MTRGARGAIAIVLVATSIAAASACAQQAPEPATAATVDVPIASSGASADTRASPTSTSSARTAAPSTTTAPSGIPTHHVKVTPAGTSSSSRAPAVSDRARAEQLFTEARGLMAAGRFAEACAKLEESMAADPAVGTLLNLAACEERRGDLARARDLYQDAADQSRASGNTSREQYARSKVAELDKKLNGP